MPSRGNLLPLTVTAIIRGAWPRNAAKEVERHVGCSPRQAWRIVSTGRAPGKFRARLLEAVENAIVRNQEELRRLNLELRAIDHEAMLDRAAARNAARVGANAGEAPRSDSGPALPLLKIE